MNDVTANAAVTTRMAMGAEFAIPDDTDYPWVGQKPIFHAMLTMAGKLEAPADPTGATSNAGLPGNSLVFVVNQVKDSRTAETKQEIRDQVIDLIENGGHPLTSRDESPYDIRIGEYRDGKHVGFQSWLVIELDPDINWQFTPGDVGCSQKHGDLGPLAGDNFFLRHVCRRADGTLDCTPTIEETDCRFLFFGVAHRGGRGAVKPADTGSFFFNLHVQFYQDLDTTMPGPPFGRATRTLELIIDPDVKNDGPDQFP